MAIKNKPIGDHVRYQVAVFYPEGWEPYGGIKTFERESEARAECQKLQHLGFQHVHMWSVTTKMIQGERTFRHSIHCAGYRGAGNPFDEASCDCSKDSQ